LEDSASEEEQMPRTRTFPLSVDIVTSSSACGNAKHSKSFKVSRKGVLKITPVKKADQKNDLETSHKSIRLTEFKPDLKP